MEKMRATSLVTGNKKDCQGFLLPPVLRHFVQKFLETTQTTLTK